MPKTYKCTLTDSVTFNLQADSEEEAYDWLQTHSFRDILNLIPNHKIDVEYSEQIHGETNKKYDIDISSAAIN